MAEKDENKNTLKSKETDDEVENNEHALELILTAEKYNVTLIKPKKELKPSKNWNLNTCDRARM